MHFPKNPHDYLATLGCLYSFWFLRWLRPDMSRTVKIGFNDINLDQTIYGGTVMFLFISTCLVAPHWPRRSVAIAGNAGMALSSMLVIVNHYLMEEKWVWAGLMYILNIWFFCAACGLMMMGQFSRYHYDSNRVKKMIVPIGSNLFLLYILLNYVFVEKTDFDDITPLISIIIHTIFAIIAQVAAPRSLCSNFFEFLQRHAET